jgi:hypothetical protein
MTILSWLVLYNVVGWLFVWAIADEITALEEEHGHSFSFLVIVVCIFTLLWLPAMLIAMVNKDKI